MNECGELAGREARTVPVSSRILYSRLESWLIIIPDTDKATGTQATEALLGVACVSGDFQLLFIQLSICSFNNNDCIRPRGAKGRESSWNLV